MKRSVTLGLLTAGFFGATLLLGGCASDGQVTAKDIWDSPTPELHSTNRSWAQNHNRTVRTWDHNLRAVVDDFDRLMLFDRPSLLTPYPVP